MAEVHGFCLEQSSTTGTGNFTLVEQTGFRRFSDAAGIGAAELFHYGIRHLDASPVEYEEGIGFMSDADTLNRVTILESSNGGAAVDFSAGDKVVVIDVNTREQQILANGMYSSFIKSQQGLINQTTTFETFVSGTLDLPYDGDYEVITSYVWSSNDTTQDFQGQLLINGAQFFEHRQEPKDSGGAGITLPVIGGGTANTGTNQRYGFTMHQIAEGLTAGNNTFDLQFAGSAGGIEPAIYEAAITVRRMINPGISI